MRRWRSSATGEWPLPNLLPLGGSTGDATYLTFSPMTNETFSESGPHARLRELGLELPAVVRPSLHFAPAHLWNGWVRTSGQVPVRNGALVAEGTVGADVDLAAAQECARQCVLNGLAAINDVAGNLHNVESVFSVTVYVASAPDFNAQPRVADAASELISIVFGEAGRHSRSAVGVIALPRRAPVEIELTAALRIST